MALGIKLTPGLVWGEVKVKGVGGWGVSAPLCWWWRGFAGAEM